MNPTRSNPYTYAAAKYLARGWEPIPIIGGPDNERYPDPTQPAKSSPPRGYTGRGRQTVDSAAVDQFAAAAHGTAANIAIVMSDGYVGIDVDDGERPGDGDETIVKSGAEHRRRIEEWLDAELPPTLGLTSRFVDGGTRAGSSITLLYRVPPGVRFSAFWFPDGDGVKTYADIDAIDPEHRYQMAAPSVHPDTGERVLWVRPDGRAMTYGEIPGADDDRIAWMPMAWVDTFGTRTASDGARPVLSRSERRQFDAAHGDAAWPGALKGVLTRFRNESLDDDGQPVAGSRHDALKRALVFGMTEAAVGFYSAADLERAVREVWVNEVMDDPRRHGHEFDSLAAWARSYAASEESVTDREEKRAKLDAHLADRPLSTEATDDGTAWRTMDNVAELVTGEWSPLEPTSLLRDDGVALFYPGETNVVFGEPETGKSWIAMVAAVEALEAGRHVLWIDAENASPETVPRRLTQLEVTAEILGERFHYVMPEVGAVGLAPLLAEIGGLDFGVVAVDSVGEVMSLDGLDENNDHDVTKWFNIVAKPLARLDSSPAVILIDHATKAGETRGPKGSARKLAAAGGTTVRAATVAPFAVGLAGMVRLMIEKDRHGGARSHTSDGKSCGYLEVGADPFTMAYVAPDGRVAQRAASAAEVHEIEDKAAERRQRINDAMLVMCRLLRLDGATRWTVLRQKVIDGLQAEHGQGMAKGDLASYRDGLVDGGYLAEESDGYEVVAWPRGYRWHEDSDPLPAEPESAEYLAGRFGFGSLAESWSRDGGTDSDRGSR